MDSTREGDEQYYSSRGFARPVGRGNAGLFSLLTYYWVNPLLDKGAKCELQEDTGEAFVDRPNRGSIQAQQFSAAYDTMRVRASRMTCLHWRYAVAALGSAMPDCHDANVDTRIQH